MKAVKAHLSPATQHDKGRTKVTQPGANKGHSAVQPSLQGQPMLHLPSDDAPGRVPLHCGE
jgi:hypothetical protein